MKRLVLIFAAALSLGAFAQSDSPVDETRTTLRHEVLRLINRDRAAHGLKPVALDVDASMAADDYCRRQIANGTNGHFTTDGLAPYMRYSFAGGNDGVSENAAAWSATYAFNERALLEMARRSQEAMMAERPPHDGHRRTILDPHATHVGVGLAWEKGEFRLAHEFIRRYVSWTHPLPRTATLHELVSARGRALPGVKVEAISVHFEPTPQPMPAHVANALSNYSLPERRKDLLPRLRTYTSRRDDGTLAIVRQEYSDGGQGDFMLTKDGTFSFNVPLTEGPGIYTVVVWVQKSGDRRAIAASNVSIRVEGRNAGARAGTR